MMTLTSLSGIYNKHITIKKKCETKNLAIKNQRGECHQTLYQRKDHSSFQRI
jgi:hypothetical protein